MAKLGVRFESIKQDFCTPDDIYERLHKEFNFQTDLAADPSNTKCKEFYSIQDNSLSKNWIGQCFLNPPYGDRKYRLSDWVRKAYLSTHFNQENNTTIVMLIPSRTNTVWFYKYCMQASEIRFILGRPIFKGQKYGFPHPLMIVIFGNIIRNIDTRISCFDLRDMKNYIINYTENQLCT